jgi:hypothetical protein
MLIETADFLYQLIQKPLNLLTRYHEKHHLQSVIDHSKAKAKGDHSYADMVKFGDKHKNKHVGDHSYACTVEESGALHNKMISTVFSYRCIFYII